jgi:hypothetical protein
MTNNNCMDQVSQMWQDKHMKLLLPMFTACIKLIIALMFNINKILYNTVTKEYFNIMRFIYEEILTFVLNSDIKSEM